MRGRRLALLLASALPLLAQDDVPPADALEWDEDEHDEAPAAGAAEALHDDSLSSLPALPVGLLDNDKKETRHHDGISLNSKEDETPSPENEELTHVVTKGSEESEDSTEANDEVPSSEGDASKTETETAHAEEDTETTGSPDASSDASESTVEKGMEQGDDPEASNETGISTEGEEQPEGGAIEDMGTELVAATKEEKDLQEEDEQIERLVVDYASKSAGALILEKSPSMKGTSNLLNADKDKYAIAPCEDKRFVVIGLSEDILVKQVRLSNYERYSSQVKDFQILGSQDMQTWADLGTYQALAANREQSFDLVEPSWARYLKFRFLSHHGSEHYCTVSQIKVHGSTMLQGFKEQWHDSEVDTTATAAETKDSEPMQEDAIPPTEDETIASKEEVSKTDETTDTSDPTQSDPAATAESSTGTIRRETSEAPVVEKEEGSDPADAVDGDTTDGAPTRESGNADAATPRDMERETDPESSASENEIDKSTTLPDTASLSSTEKEEESFDESRKENSTDALGTGNEETSSHVTEKREMEILGNRSRAFLPEALLDFKFTKEKSETLSYASIGVSSHKSARRERNFGTEQIDMIAISPTPPVNDFTPDDDDLGSERAQAADEWGIQEKTADMIKELQDKIRTRLEGSPVGAAIAHLSMSDPLHQDEVETIDDVTISSGAGRDKEDSNPPSPVENDTQSSSGVQDEAAPTELSREEATQMDLEGEKDTVDSRSEIGVSAIESANAKIGHILRRFPSAECLTGMDYEQFKAKIVSAAAGATGPTASGAGRMEPIFKTLTDEIKALQVNQSANDQFTTALVSCYQKVLLEVAAELENVHKIQEARLRLLENSIREIKAERDRSVFRVAVKFVFGFFVLCARWLKFAFLHTMSLIWESLTLHSICNRFKTEVATMFTQTSAFCRSHYVLDWKDQGLPRIASVQLKETHLFWGGVAVSFLALVAFQVRRRRGKELDEETKVTTSQSDGEVKGLETERQLDTLVGTPSYSSPETASQNSVHLQEEVDATPVAHKEHDPSKSKLIPDHVVEEPVVELDDVHRNGVNEETTAIDPEPELVTEPGVVQPKQGSVSGTEMDCNDQGAVSQLPADDVSIEPPNETPLTVPSLVAVE